MHNDTGKVIGGFFVFLSFVITGAGILMWSARIGLFGVFLFLFMVFIAQATK